MMQSSWLPTCDHNRILCVSEVADRWTGAINPCKPALLAHTGRAYGAARVY